MKKKIIFGLAIVLIPALFLVMQYRNVCDGPSDFRDAPNSEEALGQLQNSAPANFDKDTVIPAPAPVNEDKEDSGDDIWKIMDETLSQRAESTQGGSFYKNQCAWLEGYEKVKCIEHAFALDLSKDPKNAAYYKEDDSSPLFRLTDEGKKFVLANASNKPENIVAACLENLAINKDKKGPMVRINKVQAKRALAIMHESFKEGNEDALNTMRNWGCEIDGIEDITNCWMKRNCPDVQQTQ